MPLRKPLRLAVATVALASAVLTTSAITSHPAIAQDAGDDTGACIDVCSATRPSWSDYYAEQTILQHDANAIDRSPTDTTQHHRRLRLP